MSKELIVSSTAHETKVAILEDDELAEIYFEREQQYGLAGSIYKGRVTRVLPGMQSAFVNVGLERDAFLYVSDFFEDNEEYDRIVTTVEDKVVKMEEKNAALTHTAAPPAVLENGPAAGNGNGAAITEPEAATEEPGPAAGELREPTEHAGAERRAWPPASGPSVAGSVSPGAAPQGPGSRGPGGQNRDRRGRRRRMGGRGFPESKYASEARQFPRAAAPPVIAEPPAVVVPEAAELDFEVLPGESLAKYRHPSSEPAGGAGEWEHPQTGQGPEALSEEQQAEARSEEASDEYPLQAEARVEAHPPVARPASVEEAHEPATESTEGGSAVLGAVDWAPIPEPAAPVNSVEAASVVSEEPATPNVPGGSAELNLDEVVPERVTSQAEIPLTASGIVASGFEESVEESAEQSAELAEEAAEALEEIESSGVPAETSEEIAAGGEGVAATGGEAPGEQQASVRERPFGQRYLHRGSRRMRRRGRDFRERRGPGGPDRAPEAARAPSAEPAARTAQTSISDLLKEGQEIIVQIAKEPIGKKGARITSHIALPGRYLVYMPTVDHVGVSRKIFSDEERLRLKRIVQTHRVGMPGGFIVRTAGEGQLEDEIRSDMHFLYNLWIDLRQKAEQRPAPTLIHHDLNLVERLLRDQLTDTFKTIWVDSQEDYEQILQFVERFQPALVSRVKLYTRSKPIFDEFGITPELEKALRPKVWLKSGGYIVINQTEALVAIDVNTGKYVGKSNRLEDTIVKTNMDAVKEIVRQIRLRDLGGIIVVDFIDMDERKNRQKVMQALDEALRVDRSPSKILQFNDFGLVAITRKRVKQSLERTLCSPCPYCDSSGYVKSPVTMIQEILIEARKIAPTIEAGNVNLRVSPDVAKVLKSRDNSYLEELEGILRRPVLVKGDPLLHQEKFDFN